MKLKSKCCKKYKEGEKACRRCPKMAHLTAEERKKLLRRYSKR